MPELSAVEFAVYAFVTYSSLLMLIISTVRPQPAMKSMSMVRAIYMIPGVICALLIANTGVDIVLPTISSNNTITNLNTSEVWSEVKVDEQVITLQNPVWVTFHFMLAAVMLVHIILQVLMLLTKTERSDP